MIKEFKAWAKEPFSADMTAAEWFLFIGLLVIILGAWNLILWHLTSAVRAAN